MDHNKRRTRIYENKYYHYLEDDNYPRRIRKPIRILLIILIIALFVVSYQLFK